MAAVKLWILDSDDEASGLEAGVPRGKKQNKTNNKKQQKKIKKSTKQENCLYIDILRNSIPTHYMMFRFETFCVCFSSSV